MARRRKAKQALKSALLDEAAKQDTVDAAVRALLANPQSLKPPEVLKLVEFLLKIQAEEGGGSGLPAPESALDTGQYTDGELHVMIAALDAEIAELERRLKRKEGRRHDGQPA